MNAALSTDATASARRWLHLWNTPNPAARTTIEWSSRLTRSLGRWRRLIRLAALLDEVPSSHSPVSGSRDPSE